MKFTVDAIVASLNEEDYLDKTLESLFDQDLLLKNPDDVWVTLADSGSTDGTLDIARKYDVKVLDVPRGKLTARDAATRASKAEVIVALDADTVYYKDFLSTLTRHFEDPKVVAVGAGRYMRSTIGQWTEDMGAFLNAMGIWNRLCGGSCAYRKDAYVAIGGFDLSINQKNFYHMVWEEEVRFGHRLSRLGKVVWEPNAIAVTSDRRASLDPKHWQRILRGETF